jgi:hypothetical protein
MGYPPACPHCEAAYRSPYSGTETLERHRGGRADPRLPGHTGALLYLSCRTCGARYWWDFFASVERDAPS